MTCTGVQDHVGSVLYYKSDYIKEIKLSVCCLLSESACRLSVNHRTVCEIFLIETIVARKMEYIKKSLMSPLHIKNTHTRNNILLILYKVTKEIKENNNSFRWK